MAESDDTALTLLNMADDHNRGPPLCNWAESQFMMQMLANMRANLSSYNDSSSEEDHDADLQSWYRVIIPAIAIFGIIGRGWQLYEQIRLGKL